MQLTKAGRNALSEPAAGTIRTLWSKWIATRIFDELARIECVKGQIGKGKRQLSAASERRETLADCLAECKPGEWIRPTDFVRHMRATGNDCVVSYDPWGLYICDPQYGSLGYDGSAWVLEDRYALSRSAWSMPQRWA